MIFTGTLFPSIKFIKSQLTSDVMAEPRVLIEKGANIHDVVQIILLELVGHCFNGIHESIHNSFRHFSYILSRLFFFSNLLRIEDTVAYAH